MFGKIILVDKNLEDALFETSSFRFTLVLFSFLP